MKALNDEGRLQRTPSVYSMCMTVCIFKNFSLVLAVLGLRCCAGFSLAAVSRGSSPVGAPRPLTALTSLVEAHQL